MKHQFRCTKKGVLALTSFHSANHGKAWHLRLENLRMTTNQVMVVLLVLISTWDCVGCSSVLDGQICPALTPPIKLGRDPVMSKISIRPPRNAGASEGDDRAQISTLLVTHAIT